MMQNYRRERYFDFLIALGLAAIAALLYLPALGSYPLWDPWEAHYSQVAMEMVWHNSWWEPWYRNSTTSFWSKPIFTFWLMLSSLKTFRIHQVGDFAYAEFFLRLPIALTGALGVAFVFYFVRRLWNRRTGIIAALVLATSPQYFLISRQVMVDIPYVVIQVMALGFLALGIFNLRPRESEEEQRAGVRLFLGLAALFALIQFIELAYWRFRLRPPAQWAELLKFSPGAWQRELVQWQITWYQGSVLWIVLAILFAIWAIVRMYVRDPAVRSFYLFFFFSGLAFLAKGLLSIALPGGAVLLYILVTKDWDLLRRIRLVFVSEKLSLRSSIVLGIISSLAAVWWITYPMMPRVTSDLVRSSERRLSSVERRLNSLKISSKKSSSLSKKLNIWKLELQRNAIKIENFVWKKLNKFYNYFRNKLSLPAQIGWFSLAVVGMLLGVYLSWSLPWSFSVSLWFLGLFGVILFSLSPLEGDKGGAIPLLIGLLAVGLGLLFWERLSSPLKLKGRRTLGAAVVLSAILLFSLFIPLGGFFERYPIIMAVAVFSAVAALLALYFRVQDTEYLTALESLGKAGNTESPAGGEKSGGETSHSEGEGADRGSEAGSDSSGGGETGEGAESASDETDSSGGEGSAEGVESDSSGGGGNVKTEGRGETGEGAGGEDKGSDSDKSDASEKGESIDSSKASADSSSSEKTESEKEAEGSSAGDGGERAEESEPAASGEAGGVGTGSSGTGGGGSDGTGESAGGNGGGLAEELLSPVPLRSLFMGLFGIFLVALVGRFFPFEKYSKPSLFTPPVLVYSTVFILVFLVLLTLAIFWREGRRARFKPWSTGLIALTGLYILHSISFNPKLLGQFGYSFAWLMAISLAFLGLLWLYLPEDAREPLKGFLFPGVLIYLVVAGSWVYWMNYKHGLPFMREWFIYHHFQRLQGVIEKPNSSFDLYIKQIGFGMFPWSAAIPVALISFLRWNKLDVTHPKQLRNLFIFTCFFFPYFFFSFSSTKFHHYIFPVVPFLAIIVGVWLSRLFREDGIAFERMALGVVLLLFIILAKDLITNYKPLHQLFTYYTNRETPPQVYPKGFFTFVFTFFGLSLLLILVTKKFRYWSFGLLLIPVFLFVLYVNVKLIPSVAPNFSYKALYEAYKKFDRGRNLPFGEFSNWDERSTSFYFQNRSKFLGRHRVAKQFLSQDKPVFIMVSRYKIPTLRNLARSVGKRIYIIDRPHFDMWLVSTEPPRKDRSLDNIRFSKLPPLPAPFWKRVNVDFGGKARLIAVYVNKPEGYRRGDKVELRFLFKVTGKFRRDWKVFIHADPVKWTRHRLNWDHEMAEGLYPTSEWKVGEYVQDVVIRRIPRDYPAHYTKLHIYMGLWLGSARVPIRYSNVYTDGQNRALVVTLKLLKD